MILDGTTIGDAWLKACHTVMAQGSPMTDGDLLLKEVMNLYIQIQRPVEVDKVIEQDSDPRMVEWMRNNFLSLSPIDGWGYSYGQRLMENDGVNQLDLIVNRLRKNPTSKSATISFLNPRQDTSHIPCICTLDFKKRNDVLHLVGFFRSQDISKKMYADALALTEILQRVADSIGSPVGSLNLLIVSAHIYETDFERTENLLRRRQEYIETYKEA